MKKIRFLYKEIRAYLGGVFSRNLGVYASSSAFYIFLSVAPCIMLVCSFLPASRIESHELREFMQYIVPATVSDFVEDLIEMLYHSTVAVRSISAITTIWTASKALASIMRGIERASSDTKIDPAIKLHLKAMLYSAIMMLAIYVLMMGTFVLSFLKSQDIIIMRASKVIGAVVLMLILVFAYKFVPDTRLPLKKLLPGAGAAAVAWMGFTYIYGWWLNVSGNYGVYGSLGSVIITLLWTYFSMYIVLMGAHLNYYLLHREKE